MTGEAEMFWVDFWSTFLVTYIIAITLGYLVGYTKGNPLLGLFLAAVLGLIGVLIMLMIPSHDDLPRRRPPRKHKDAPNDDWIEDLR